MIMHLELGSKEKAMNCSKSRVDFMVISCMILGISRYMVSSRYITFESILARYYLSYDKNLILLVSLRDLHQDCMHKEPLFMII